MNKNPNPNTKIPQIPSTVKCHYPWAGLQVGANKEISPCCWMSANMKILDKSHEFDPTPFDINKDLNTTAIKELRRQMLGDAPLNDVCYDCIITRGATSYSRLHLLTPLEMTTCYNVTGVDGYFDYHKHNIPLKDAVISFGNKCNLECRMCNSYASSKLMIKYNKLDRPSIAKLNKVEAEFTELNKKDIDLDSISSFFDENTVVSIVGGEPLLNKNAFEFIDNSPSMIGIVTNGTVRLNDKIKKVLDHPNIAVINFSIDSIPKINDYQRSGSNTELIKKNAIEYIAYKPDIIFNIAVCITNITFEHLPAFFDEILTEYQHMGFAYIVFEFVTGRPELSLEYLPATTISDTLVKFDSILSKLNKLKNPTTMEVELILFIKLCLTTIKPHESIYTPVHQDNLIQLFDLQDKLFQDK